MWAAINRPFIEVSAGCAVKRAEFYLYKKNKGAFARPFNGL